MPKEKIYPVDMVEYLIDGNEPRELADMILELMSPEKLEELAEEIRKTRQDSEYSDI